MKKKIILIIVIFILLIVNIYLLSNYVFARLKNKAYLEKYDIAFAEELSNSNFTIDKIMLYSSASAINKNSNFRQTDWILDILQYTDIAICFNKPKELNASNTAETLSISNVNLQVSSNNFTPSLYYLDANHFGTGNILSDYKIEDTLEFTVLNFDNEDNSIMYNTPVFFSDLSNPITIKFTNLLYKNYSIENTEKLIFDGNLLSKTPLKAKDLKASLSFDINLSNFEKEKYSTNISLEIPIENSKESIFDGKVLETKKMNLPLLRIQKDET